MVEGKASVDADSCIDCGACIDACPVEAISL
jgi:ferredoxin